MIALKLILAGENAWPDLAKIEPDRLIHLGNGSPAMQVAVLERGMVSGRPSVAIRLDLPDGRVVIAETTARLFCTAGRAIAARYPDDGGE